MRRSQGRCFSEEEIKRIRFLLASTDMTMQDIATRMGCAKSSVVNINQTFYIRDYRGRRSCWVMNAFPGDTGKLEEPTEVIATVPVTLSGVDG